MRSEQSPADSHSGSSEANRQASDRPESDKNSRFASALQDDQRADPEEVSRDRRSNDQNLAVSLDAHSLEAVVELKITRFLEQIGTYYPDNIYDLIMHTVERPLIRQILLRTGGNQVQAAKILGINRNTLRKKIKTFGL